MATELGFNGVGIARAEQVQTGSFLDKWLSKGLHGTMNWMTNYPEKRKDPRLLMPGAKSIVCVALNYYDPQPIFEKDGKISRYAWGTDYHIVVRKKLAQLLERIQEADNSIEGKCCVDTAPIMDKYWAAKAGLGWQGKHTNLINREYGSWLFLGEILLNADLEYDRPVEDFCGTCNRCIDACPTDAIVEPYVLDARKCISYITIEYRGDSFPADFNGQLDNWIFGCDVCQDVCPWNQKFAQPTDVPGFNHRKDITNVRLGDWAGLTEEQYRERFSKSAVKRTKYKGLKRNIKEAKRTPREGVKVARNSSE